jgi:hypothetical protein
VIVEVFLGEIDAKVDGSSSSGHEVGSVR